jgi:hypothetical protein
MQDRVAQSAAALRAIAGPLESVHLLLRRGTIVPEAVRVQGATLVRDVGLLRRLVAEPLDVNVNDVPRPVSGSRPLGERVSALKAQIAGSASAPTALQLDCLAQLQQELAHVMRQVMAVISGSLPALNRQLEAQGLSPVRAPVKLLHS